MVAYADCPYCMSGDHSKHVRDWNVHEGLIGGSACYCKGDCAERARQRFESFMTPFVEAQAPTTKNIDDLVFLLWDLCDDIYRIRTVSDQWWLVVAECPHGRAEGISNSVIDPSKAWQTCCKNFIALHTERETDE